MALMFRASCLGVLVALLASRATADEGTARARRYCKAHKIALYRYHEARIGNTQGHLAPIIRTRDGGTLVVGTLNGPGTHKVGRSRPVVVRFDATGKRLWQRAFTKRPFVDHEGGSAVESQDGYIVYILSYVHPARGSVARLLKLSTSGKVIWERQLRGTGGARTPFPQTIQLTAGGTLQLRGHIYQDRSETAHEWEGEVDGRGRVTLDRVGAARRPERR